MFKCGTCVAPFSCFAVTGIPKPAKNGGSIARAANTKIYLDTLRPVNTYRAGMSGFRSPKHQSFLAVVYGIARRIETLPMSDLPNSWISYLRMRRFADIGVTEYCSV